MRPRQGTSACSNRPPRGPKSSSGADFQHFVTNRALWNGDGCLFPDLLADESLADRAGDENSVLVVIFIPRADELEDLFLGKIEVLDADPRAEDDRIRGQRALID